MNKYEINKKDHATDREKYIDLSKYGINEVYNLHFLQDIKRLEENAEIVIKCKKTRQNTFNHVWFYRFKTMERAIEQIKQTIESRKAELESIAERKQTANLPHKLKVGQTLVCSWGYDQTNIDFYQITKLIGNHFVEVQSINCDSVDYCEYTDKKTIAQIKPVVLNGSQITRHRVRTSEFGGKIENSIKINSFSWAYPVEKRSYSQTGFGYGH